MNCNLTNTERINGSQCRSWNCEPCREFFKKEESENLKQEITVLKEQLVKANEIISHCFYDDSVTSGIAYEYLEQYKLLKLPK